MARGCGVPCGPAGPGPRRPGRAGGGAGPRGDEEGLELRPPLALAAVVVAAEGERPGGEDQEVGRPVGVVGDEGADVEDVPPAGLPRPPPPAPAQFGLPPLYEGLRVDRTPPAGRAPGPQRRSGLRLRGAGGPGAPGPRASPAPAGRVRSGRRPGGAAARPGARPSGRPTRRPSRSGPGCGGSGRPPRPRRRSAGRGPAGSAGRAPRPGPARRCGRAGGCRCRCRRARGRGSPGRRGTPRPAPPARRPPPAPPRRR